MPRRDLLIISGLFICLCLMYLLWSASITEPGFPLDDSWIHQVFARNLAAGQGFSFNPGHPMAGATAPLWSILLVVPRLLLGAVAGGIFPGVLLMGLSLLAVYRLTYLLARERRVAFVAAVVSSLCGVLVWGALAGMEVGLYSALSLWGLYFYFQARSLKDRRNLLAYSLFALAVVSRPECALFLVAALTRDALAAIKTERDALLPWLWRLAIIGVVLGPYFAFNHATTGTLFPQTFTAKVHGKGLVSVLIGGEIKRIVKDLTVFPYFYAQEFWTRMTLLNPFLTLAFLPGVIKLVRSGGGESSKKVMLIVLLVLYAPLMGAFSPASGPTMQSFRLVANLIPLAFMMGTIGLLSKTEGTVNRVVTVLAVVGVVLLIVGFSLKVANDYIVRQIGPILAQDFSHYSQQDRAKLFVFVSSVARGTVLIGCMFLSGWAWAWRARRASKKARPIGKWLALAAVGYALLFAVHKGYFYANNVRNVNECDKEAGLFLRKLAEPGDVVATNDIGAIGYFSEMEVLDLKGLITPQITPAMIENDSLAFQYMLDHKRVDYLAIFPNWFEYIPKRDDVFKPITSFETENNTILAGDSLVVYKAFWDSAGKADSTDGR